MSESSAFGDRALAVMRARSGGRCEWCGGAGRLEAHHRLYRSRGGLGGAANGVLLCGFGNAAGCHGRAHMGEGLTFGFSLPSGAVAEAEWVHLRRFGQRCLLTDSGLVLAADGVACWAHSSEWVGGKAGCSACAPAGRVLWEFEEEKGWAA